MLRSITLVVLKKSIMEGFWGKSKLKDYLPIPGNANNEVENRSNDLCTKSIDKAKLYYVIAISWLRKVSSNFSEVAREEPNSYLFRCLIAGALMVTSSFLEALFHLVKLQVYPFFFSLYSLSFGFVICLAEGIIFELPSDWRTMLFSFAPIFHLTVGRGAYFLFVGFFQLIQEGGLFFAVSGCWSLYVGVVYIMAGLGAKEKMVMLCDRYNITSELEDDFSTFSSDENPGYLSNADFLRLLESKGISASNFEVEACFQLMESEYNEKLSLTEFTAWFEIVSGL